MVLRTERVKFEAWDGLRAGGEMRALRLSEWSSRVLPLVMARCRHASFAFVVALLSACCARKAAEPTAPAAPTTPAPPASWGAPWVARTGTWPSAACVDRAEKLLLQMTLAEKVGQMTQASRETIKPGDVQKYFLGSVLSGGGSAPGSATPDDWARMTDTLHAEALATRLAIPLVYGSDAVHGHGNVVGATMFPHNIGLGAARDEKLVEAIARATALEMAATGVDWTFAPAVAASRDERWGRTYETFSELPSDAGRLGAAAVRGYQGERLGSSPLGVLACAKHYAGDGATAWKTAKGGLLDQGDTRLSPEDFRRIALAPYPPSIAAGVGSIMVSFSSVHGKKMHGHRELVTDVLKGELGFRGFVVTDWTGIQQLPGSYPDQIASSVNAGIDMFMEPYHWKDFIAHLEKAVETKQVPVARIDDAVRRIVTVKCEAGLFEKGPVDRSLMKHVASPEHRRLAFDAALKSAVLLKNEGGILPLATTARVVVAGVGARSLTRQAGGWTVGWQGADDKPFVGETVFEGFARIGGDAVRYVATGAADPTAEKPPDVGVLVISEPAYAEGRGDSETLEPSKEDLAALDALVAQKLRVVVVILSGRPLIIEPHLGKAQAWLAAFLPGSEAHALAHIVYGKHAPTGKLSHSWPRRIADLPLNVGDRPYEPLFSYGHGLTFAQKNDAPTGAVAPKAN